MKTAHMIQKLKFNLSDLICELDPMHPVILSMLIIEEFIVGKITEITVRAKKVKDNLYRIEKKEIFKSLGDLMHSSETKDGFGVLEQQTCPGDYIEREL